MKFLIFFYFLLVPYSCGHNLDYCLTKIHGNGFGLLYSSPISSFQSWGLSLMKRDINSSHCLSFMLTTSIPSDSNNSSAPKKFLFSPKTTLLTPYMIHAPEHMLHGDKVVYMVHFL